MQSLRLRRMPFQLLPAALMTRRCARTSDDAIYRRARRRDYFWFGSRAKIQAAFCYR
jgi:hypothetical protein